MHINAYKLAKNILHRSERILDSHIYIYIYIYIHCRYFIQSSIQKERKRICDIIAYTMPDFRLCQILFFFAYSTKKFIIARFSNSITRTAILSIRTFWFIFTLPVKNFRTHEYSDFNYAFNILTCIC